jgi:hypothetical protein
MPEDYVELPVRSPIIYNLVFTIQDQGFTGHKPISPLQFEIIYNVLTGHALEISICGCSLFHRRELLASKSAGFTK